MITFKPADKRGYECRVYINGEDRGVMFRHTDINDTHIILYSKYKVNTSVDTIDFDVLKVIVASLWAGAQ